MAANGAFAILVVFFSACVRGHHECERPCLEYSEPKNCYYHFTLGIGFKKCVNVKNEECQQKLVLTINGESPGPFVSVCQNDTITVDVRNVLPLGMETAIHWHGIPQRGSPHMDGIPMITQCPIHSGNTFRYQFRAEKAGTFYYHAHSVLQQLDGLYGALIIRDDTSVNDKTILLAPQFQDAKSIQTGLVTDLVVSGLQAVAYDSDGKPNKIRLINAAALDCTVNIISTGMTVVSLDGNNIEPTVVNNLILHPGERADILEGSDMQIIGRKLCEGFRILTNSTEDSEGSLMEYFKHFYTGSDIELESYKVFIPFDASDCTSITNPDFRYKLGEVTPFVPAYISDCVDASPIYQFRNVSFVYPSSPLISEIQTLDEDMVCTLGTRAKRCTSDFCECLQILNLPFNTTVDLVLVDEGKHGKTDQTFHLHGASFRLIGIGSFDKPITTDQLINQIDSGMMKLDLVTYMEKDTVVVPNPGYAVLRIKTNNPGYWLLESIPSKAKSGAGLEMILHVPSPVVRSYPKNFPTCGSLKPQDLVIIDD